MHKYLYYLINKNLLKLGLIHCLFFVTCPSFAAESVRILIVHAYSQEYPWTRGQHEGFVNHLKQLLPTQPTIKTEYLDTKRISFDDTYTKQYSNFIREKYQNFRPHAIYVTDDDGLKFAHYSLLDLFPDSPIFFSGVNDYSFKAKLNPERETGVFEKKEIEPNLNLLEILFDDVRKIVIVGDNSTTYQAIEHELKQELSLRKNLNVSYIAEEQIDTILSRLQAEQPFIILLTTLGAIKDNEGKTLNIEETIARISASGAKVIMSMEDGYLYDGVLGGYVTSGTAQGRTAASLFFSHLQGVKMSSLLPISVGQNEYVFDDRVLEKLNLTLPEDIAESAKILHPRMNFFQRYQAVMLMVMIILALALIATILIYALVTSRKNNALNVQSRKLNEQRQMLQESEEKYRLLFERSDDPMLLIYEHKFVLANDSTRRILGYDSLFEFFQVHPSKLSPEFQPDGQASLDKANDMMQLAYQKGYHRFEWQHLKKDGTPLLVEVSLTRIPYGHENALFCIWRDITDWRKAKLSLREKTTYLNSILSASINVGFIATDTHLNIHYYNEVAAKIFNISSDKMEKQNINFFHRDVNNLPQERIDMALRQAQVEGEYRFSMNLTRNDKAQYIDARISPILDGDKLVGYTLMAEDVTQRHEAEELIKFQANYDCLTNLPNRRTLSERLVQSLSLCHRHNHYGAILFIDLDNFKHINDTLGHTIGDTLLKKVAKSMSDVVRNEDTVARLGGDEFVILLSETDDDLDIAINEAQKVADKLIKIASQNFRIEGNDVRTSISIGISVFPTKNESADDILRQADTAMYQAKDAGRNNFKFFSPEMHQKVKNRMLLLDMLHQAIEKQEFEIYFQAQVDKHKTLIGVESLVRWNNPDRGIIYPDEFIALAEESGLIEPISEFVLRQSLAAQLRWQQLFPAQAVPNISVNVSAVQFKKDNFVKNIQQVVNELGCNPDRLTLELTESMLLDNVDQTIIKMQSLQELGIRFSIDDFGTGYSSLFYLKKLPISEIKIDRSFVKDILTDHNDSALVSMIMSLARLLNMDVVAEGVETKAIYDALIESGCHIFQGYYFSKPVPEQKFIEKFLKK